MKLSEYQTRQVWDSMIEAEVRSLYFGELAARHTRYKQLITGASLFLSSGAAVSIAAQVPKSVPILMTTITAILTAFSIAVGLDRKIVTLVKLHGEWHQLQHGYEHLWSHAIDEGAEEIFQDLETKERAASELGLEMGPYDEALIDKWMKVTYARYQQPEAA